MLLSFAQNITKFVYDLNKCSKKVLYQTPTQGHGFMLISENAIEMESRLGVKLEIIIIRDNEQIYSQSTYLHIDV